MFSGLNCGCNCQDSAPEKDIVQGPTVIAATQKLLFLNITSFQSLIKYCGTAVVSLNGHLQHDGNSYLDGLKLHINLSDMHTVEASCYWNYAYSQKTLSDTHGIYKLKFIRLTPRC